MEQKLLELLHDNIDTLKLPKIINHLHNELELKMLKEELAIEPLK